MGLAVATVLILGLILGTAALAIAIPFGIGMMAYDIIQSRKSERASEPVSAPVPADAKTAGGPIAVKRGVARAFVLFGAAFWSLASFAELYSLRQAGAGEAALMALIPLGASLVTLVVGWYWERLTAVALSVAAFGVVAYGVVYQFTPQVWALVTLALIGPMLTASVLFWLARREQEAYERATSLRPEMAFAFDARSTLGK